MFSRLSAYYGTVLVPGSGSSLEIEVQFHCVNQVKSAQGRTSSHTKDALLDIAHGLYNVTFESKESVQGKRKGAVRQLLSIRPAKRDMVYTFT